ncbi:MAG: hypothetical protein DCC50_02495 [Acidobacteria bacterium]|nr:MAG: hypothetical protein DCC50_02495 [Acidobacteriota bacterium]
MRNALTSRPVRRRTLLFGCAALVSVPACRPRATSSVLQSADVTGQTVPLLPARPLTPAMAALHVHASFSEGGGSMEAQLAQADLLGAQVVWWTEHDWRMAGLGYLRTIPVGSADGDGLTWTLLEDRTTAGAGTHVFGAESPGQVTPEGSASLYLAAQAEPTAPAEHALSFSAERDLFSTSLQGQIWHIWVRPIHLDRGDLELRLRTSRRPAHDGQDAGDYHLSYRFGESAPRSIQVAERVATVPVVSPVGRWTLVTLRPEDDLKAAWPRIDGRDASCTQITVAARARPGGSVSGLLGAVTIDRLGLADDSPLAAQRELMTRYASGTSAIRQLQGVEISSGTPHICWYGGAPRLPVTAQPAHAGTVEAIHACGGVASYAHPFGVDGSEPDPQAQDELLAEVAEQLLPARMLGCDALEVGYRRRGGATLATHESLWDLCSRQAIFLTGLGVHDNHSGMNWDKGPNNFVSWLWSRSLDEDDLLCALRSGYVYFGDPVRFTGQLDLRTSSGGHMGSVASSTGPTTPVELIATGLPAGTSLELVRQTLAGATAPGPALAVDTTTFVSEEIVDGRVVTNVPTGSDCFVRTRVRDREDQVIALSNPLWLVADQRAYAVPADRRTGYQSLDPRS